MQAFGNKIVQLQAANANAHEKLTSGKTHLRSVLAWPGLPCMTADVHGGILPIVLFAAVRHCEELKEHIMQLTASMEHNSLQHRHECEQLVSQVPWSVLFLST